MTDRAQRLAAAGYGPLVSVIPPGADISPGSSIDPDMRGKVPGRWGRKGWYGYAFTHPDQRPTPKEIDEMGANVGLLGDNFPALDIDSDSPKLTEFVMQRAQARLMDAPTRLSTGARRLLVFRTEEPFERMGLVIRAAGETHLVEWLGRGRQYLVAGTHPSGKEYRWRGRDLDRIPPAALGVVSREVALAFLEELAEELGRRPGFEVEVVGTGRSAIDRAVDQDDLLAPDRETLADVVSRIPNTQESSPDRTHYLAIGYAIKAAGGDIDIWHEWCDKRPPDDRVDGNPETRERDWAKMHPPYRAGFGWLADEAAQWDRTYSPAVDEFAAFVLPEQTEAGQPNPHALGISMAELARNPELLRDPEELTELLAWRGRLTMLHGREKAGKSTLMTQEFVDAAREGKRLLWLSFEEPLSGIVSRFHKMADGDEEVLDRIITTKVQADNWAKVEALVAVYQPDVIMFDSLNSAGTALFGRNPESSQSGEWMDLVQKFRALALGPEGEDLRGIVLLHHSKKEGDEYSGSHGIGAAVDMIAKYKELTALPNTRSLEFKGRWYVDSVRIEMDADRRLSVREPADLEQRILAALREEPRTTRALRDVVTGKTTAIGKAVDRLLKQERIVKRRGGVLHPAEMDEFDQPVPDEETSE